MKSQLHQTGIDISLVQARLPVWLQLRLASVGSFELLLTCCFSLEIDGVHVVHEAARPRHEAVSDATRSQIFEHVRSHQPHAEMAQTDYLGLAFWFWVLGF
jgi:hypothetical protein